ncbi:MAG: rod-binding protein [Lachnospiraceae bacterium]|nr:rod-binding protein [Lachnospiraceae bacterium]
MGINGIGGISAMIDQTNTSAANSKANALQNSLSGDLKSATDEELMDVCKEFEAYFIEQVMKEVEKTIPKTEEDSTMSQYTDFFKEQMMQDLAAEISDKQSIGLAQQMYEQMKRNYSL